jgi:hypothetical protein
MQCSAGVDAAAAASRGTVQELSERGVLP